MPDMQNDYSLSTADLQRASISPDTVNRIIAQSVMQTQQSGQAPDVTALLAAMLKTQAKASVKINSYPFTIESNNCQQILPENPNRSFLIIQGFNSAIIFINFDIGPQAQQAIPGGFNTLQCLSFDGSFPIPTIEFNPVPTNAVTIYNADVTAHSGVIFEA